jgi:glutamate racemase
VVEVIQPAVRRAVATTRNNRVGVIGTTATIESMAYNDAFAAAVDIQLSSRACPRFVEFVERGITSGPEVLAAAESYLADFKQADIDTLVLGCTHYPLLSGVISYVLGEGVNLVSSAEETALDVFRTLTQHDLLANSDEFPVRRFLATGDPMQFEQLARRFLGPEVAGVEKLPMPEKKEDE